MAGRRARATPADPRIDGPIKNGPINNGPINNGPIDDFTINGITPTTNFQTFALAIAHMSLEAALARTAQHIEKLRKAHTMEEVASIELDFVQQSLEHAAEQTRRVCEMLAALPRERTKTYQTDWLQLVNAAVQTAKAAWPAAAQRAAARMFSLNG